MPFCVSIPSRCLPLRGAAVVRVVARGSLFSLSERSRHLSSSATVLSSTSVPWAAASPSKSPLSLWSPASATRSNDWRSPLVSSSSGSSRSVNVDQGKIRRWSSKTTNPNDGHQKNNKLHPRNEQINLAEFVLVDHTGRAVGKFSKDVAIRLARQRRMDVEEVSAKTNPPVCRLAPPLVVAPGAGSLASSSAAANLSSSSSSSSSSAGEAAAAAAAAGNSKGSASKQRGQQENKDDDDQQEEDVDEDEDEDGDIDDGEDMGGKSASGSPSKKRRFNFLRVNLNIKAPVVQLRGLSGEFLGVHRIEKAREIAQSNKVSIVETDGSSNPPICTLMTQEQLIQHRKKFKQDAKAAKGPSMKEVRLGNSIFEPDMARQVEKIRSFLQQGHQVRLRVMRRGSQSSVEDSTERIFEQILSQLSDVAVTNVEAAPKGNVGSLILVPKKKPPTA